MKLAGNVATVCWLKEQDKKDKNEKSSVQRLFTMTCGDAITTEKRSPICLFTLQPPLKRSSIQKTDQVIEKINLFAMQNTRHRGVGGIYCNLSR